VLLIPCPFCGPRDDNEYRYGGEAGIAVPADTPDLTDEAWAEFLFVRHNPKGPMNERWYHAHGCRRWFTLARDTSTDAVLSAPEPVGDSEMVAAWRQGQAAGQTRAPEHRPARAPAPMSAPEPTT
jgi:heterotetrameric sarcosine oxidase delta subunit